jgi:hypothetical protein
VIDKPPTEKVVRFSPLEAEGHEQKLRRLASEAERLADQSEMERSFWMPKRADEIGVPVATLKSAVTAVLRERAQRTAAEQLEKERERKRQDQQRAAEEREEQKLAKEEARERRRAKEKEEREQKRLAKEAERKQQRAENEIEQKSKRRAKGLGNILRLPVARHEGELVKLAKQLGDDVAALRQELAGLLGLDEASDKTEPWPESVELVIVLKELGDKISRYVVLQEHLLTAGVLWAAHAWLYDHNVPTHSPILAATSPESDSGKSTLVAALGRTTPRYSLNIEMTGPSLYRHVDAVKPTLVIDEADDLFVRKSDLKHIVNAGWTRGAKIPRQVNISGVWTTVYFDPFTPKAISLLGRNLPAATRTRCIELRMLPKRSDEKVEDFNQLDDAQFAVLRRKLARFAADNAVALKDAQPQMPTGLNNRVAANWKLLLAIAERAGGPWLQRAREAAKRLSQSGRRPSDGVQLLAAIRTMFEGGKTELTSEAIVAELRSDPTVIWVDYNRGGPITQRQVAHLLSAYDIYPGPLHPTRRSDFARRGYKYEQFADAFARYLPADPIIRSSKPGGGKDAEAGEAEAAVIGLRSAPRATLDADFQP